MKTRAALIALLLLAFVVPAQSGCMGAAAARRTTRAVATLELIQRVDGALRAYVHDHGAPPAGEASAIARTLSTTAAPGGGSYLELPASVYLRGGGPFDSWDRPLVVHVPAAQAKGPADIYSVGENGRDENGTGDDITAWGGFDPALYAASMNPFDPAVAIPWAAIVLATFCAGLVVRVRRRKGMAARAPALEFPTLAPAQEPEP